MKDISVTQIGKAVRDLLIEANYKLPTDLQAKINESAARETNPLAKTIFGVMQENSRLAEAENYPLCQDTGMVTVYMEVGQEVHFTGGSIEEAVNAGVRAAYDEGYLRKSVVKSPLFDRVNTSDNTPCVLYTSLVDGDRVRLTVCPKGFGSENMSRIKMFTPSAGRDDIIAFVTDTVKIAGGNPCPPLVIGIGLGGTFDYAAHLSKKALLLPTAARHPDERYAALESDILDAVNALYIGCQGFGGDTTVLAAHILTYPTHIAGLPCAVNIGCHITRHASGFVE